MNRFDWEKVKDVFALAVEQPTAKRAAFLREICADDAVLRSEVESLLAASDEPEHLIEKKDFSAAVFGSNGAASYAGKQFGHYKILREIGRGGMGAVFLAERSDGEFNQQVALKIVHRSFADNELGRRFRQERQILASLNHPNIARLLDGGVSDDGEPFLAMEFVDGVRIDEFCAARGFPLNERLKLFLQVCAAVQFAHQNLVVHRDIKPSNIIVGEDGTPKLLDFGIAKLLDAEHAGEHTRTGQRAFTPDYASPEQIAGALVTTATDVYSLGVLLSNLVESLKSEVQSHSEAKTIRQNTGTKSAVQNPKSEIEMIAAMARREEPTRRYASVEQFADDVQRYLAGKPIIARKDSFAYRAEKFVRRNRVPVFAAALVAVSLVAGLAISLRQADAARRERDRAQKRFADVRELSNALLNDIAPKMERLPGSTEARQALVNQSLKYLDGLANESADDLQLQAELAAAYEKVGELQGAPRKPNLSDFRGAIQSYEKAAAIRRGLLEKNPNDWENQKRLAENLSQSGYIRWWTNDIAGSVPDAEKTLEIYQKLLREGEQPAPLDLRLATAEAQINVAQMYFYAEQLDKTHPLLNESFAALSREQRENVEVRKLLARNRSLLGNTLSWEDKQPAAESEMTEARGIAESLVRANPRDNVLKVELYDVYMQSSSIYESINDPLSLEYLQKARALVEESIRDDAANVQARQNLAKVNSKIGLLYIRLKKEGAAVPYLEKALATLAELLSNAPNNQNYQLDVGRNTMFVGLANFGEKKYTRALDYYAQTAEILETLIRADSQSVTPRRTSASLYTYTGEAENALARAADDRAAHRQAARENYHRALHIFQQLQAENRLSEYDQRYIDEVQTALTKLDTEK